MKKLLLVFVLMCLVYPNATGRETGRTVNWEKYFQVSAEFIPWTHRNHPSQGVDLGRVFKH